MASVNDIVHKLPESDFVGEMLRQASRTAWHPVSDPPTQLDGDSYGLVVVYTEDGATDHMFWNNVALPHSALAVTHWARVRDVVLMPPEDV